MEKNEEMLEFEFLDELEDKSEIPDKVNYENEYYEYFKDINEIIRNSEHPKWDIVKATIKEAARDTFEKISFGVTNNRFVNGFKDRWNEMINSDIVFIYSAVRLLFYCAERPDPEDGEKAGSNGYSRTAEAGMESTHLCVGWIFPCTV